MSDLIDKQAAIDEILGHPPEPHYPSWYAEQIKRMPAAQPPLDEWCTDCKEYDHERHCCPRWNRVIRQTLASAQPQRMRGQWVEVTDGIGIWKVCDQCGEKPLWNEWKTDRCESDYCPNCGADMRGEQDGLSD